MLHHQRTGEVIISILLMQDLLAIVLLLVVGGAHGGMQIAGYCETVRRPACADRVRLDGRALCPDSLDPQVRQDPGIHLLVTIGWCLGMAELAVLLGLSAEIGAFIAGVVLASSPIAMFIAESLKPLR